MFRIHFEPRGGYWCIQFLRWGLFWVTVTPDSVASLSNARKRFSTFDEACQYVEETGIDRAYQCRESSGMLNTSYVTHEQLATEVRRGSVPVFRSVRSVGSN